MTEILILGQYGQGSVGDEAILCGIMNSLGAYIDDAKFSVITSDAIETASLHNVISIEQSYKKGLIPLLKNTILKQEMAKVYGQICNCDLFVVGGGTSFQDLKMHYLPIILSLIKLAEEKGKKTVIYGVGAGPIETNLGKILCKTVLNKVDLISVRDRPSKMALEGCGLKNVVLTADPAFAMNIPNQNYIDYVLNTSEANIKANSISSTLYSWLCNAEKFRNPIGPTADIYHRRRRIADVFDKIIDYYGKDLMLLTTFKGDYYGYKELIKHISRKHEVLIPRYDSDYRYVLSLLSTSDVLIGMRLHSLIFAAMLGVPFVPLSYSRKVNGFLDMLGLNELYVDIESLMQEESSELFFKILTNVWENKADFSRILLNRSHELKIKAMDNARMVEKIMHD